ncbi:MAG: CPBP family intramembrane metalloprotease [Bacteroidales bacterium]|nr:CPBP family intramembrane metalloprotease [Bacteroidales bacterium]
MHYYLEGRPIFMQLIFLGLLVVASFLATMLAGMLLVLPFTGGGLMEMATNLDDFSDPETVALLKYFQIVNQLGVFVIPSIAFAVFATGKPWDYLNMNRFPKGRLVFFSVLLIIFSVPWINQLVVWNESWQLPGSMAGMERWMKHTEEQARQLTDAFMKNTTWQGFAVNLLMISVLAGVGEELLFRGVLQKLFTALFRNIHWGVFSASLLFSVMHLQFYGLVPRLLLGIMFGYLLVWTGSLWIPVLLHALFNGVTVVVYFMAGRNWISSDPETFGSSSDPWILTASVTLSLFFFLLISRAYSKKTGNRFRSPVHDKEAF